METSGDRDRMRRYAHHLKTHTGLNMRALRLLQGRKQLDIAHDTDLSQSTISRMERGQGRFTAVQVSAVAVCLGVEVEDLQRRPPLPEEPDAG
jgi:transcriptional regulator with XRE-family HTH domain